MRILELFAGIGACSIALKRLGINVEIVDAVEIDKYAIKSFNAIHNTKFEPQDVVEWDKNFDNIDLIMHGSPCQDFSIAGRQAGGDKDSGTRSSLLYETIRIVENIKPKYVIWENVKNLLSKKHKHNFDNYINKLDELGYNSYYKVLDAKNYGVPQHRERIYTVSIRKDTDKGDFKFPEKEPLKIVLKDLLEKEVDKKYYLDDKQFISLKNSICARDFKDPKCIQVGELNIKGIDQIKRIYSPDGLSPTLTTMGGGNREPKIEVIGNYMPSGHDASRVVNSNGLAPTVKENHGTVTATNVGSTVRKLTPLECWRLMSFDDDDFNKAKNVPTSNTQLYKQAGNSIVVNVLEKIFSKLFN